VMDRRVYRAVEIHKIVTGMDAETEQITQVCIPCARWWKTIDPKTVHDLTAQYVEI
jgi:hypothetical protein